MTLTEAQIRQFREEGHLFFPELFSPEEVDILKADVDRAQTTSRAWSSRDRNAETKAISLWMEPGDSAFDLLRCLPRLVVPTRQLLEDEIYHWHSKFTFKAPRTGGSWHWHQDYGYWYHDGCPTARMLSVMVFLDEARLDNGCLKFLVGAHHLGRLEHGQVEAGTEGTQMGMPLTIVEEAKKRFEVRPMIGKPGGTVFWHSNLPHQSDDNRSDFGRLAIIVCYNAMSNAPGEGKGHGKPIPVEMVADDALLKWRARATS
jgi:hypothetical protein